jgi:DNA-binding HxlR family transcriptional regulator
MIDMVRLSVHGQADHHPKVLQVARAKMKKQPGPESKRISTIFIGKWTVKILASLNEGPHRHGQLRRRLGSVSQRMLTRNVRNLESAGLIARRVTKSKSIAVEYSLTKLGRTFIRPLVSICGWANRHHKELNAVVRLLEASNGTHIKQRRTAMQKQLPRD